jgi:hypothetical protein
MDLFVGDLHNVAQPTGEPPKIFWLLAMNQEPTLRDVRAGLWGHLKRGPTFAAVAGMGLDQLQAFVAGQYRPTPAQLHQLRLVLRLLEEPA